MVVLGRDDTMWPGVETLRGKPVLTTMGGAERSDSVLSGIDALPEEVGADDFVLVHDAARPCVRLQDISRLIVQGSAGEGGLLGAPVRDTLKLADAEFRSTGTEPRDRRWRAFTPQMFRRAPLADALRAAGRSGVSVSDEAMAMERAGIAPLLIEGAEDNIKVTTAADFALAEFLLSRTRA